jgi:coiled-coil domain-containing protein 55
MRQEEGGDFSGSRESQASCFLVAEMDEQTSSMLNAGGPACSEMSAPKLSFALGKLKPKEAPVPSLSKPTTFGSLDDDDPIDAAPTASTSSALDVNRRLAAQNVSTPTSGGSLSRTAKRKMQQELAVDPTVYQYDEVFDRMKEAQIKAKSTKEQESQERKVGIFQIDLVPFSTRY